MTHKEDLLRLRNAEVEALSRENEILRLKNAKLEVELNNYKTN
jgi:hypothetical protein